MIPRGRGADFGERTDGDTGRYSDFEADHREVGVVVDVESRDGDRLSDLSDGDELLVDVFVGREIFLVHFWRENKDT